MAGLFDMPEVRIEKSKSAMLAKKAGKSSPEKVSVRGQNDLQIRLQMLAQRVPFSRPEWLVTDYDVALAWIDDVDENEILFVDTETTGLNPLTDTVVGICFADLKRPEPIYIPFGHVDFNGQLQPGQLSYEQVRGLVEKIKNIGCVFHNAKFDIRMIKNTFKFDYYQKVEWCTFIASNFLNENESHSLKDLWGRYCGDKASDKFSELFQDIPFARVPITVASQYAAKDPLMTRDLYLFQLPYLDGKSEQCVRQDLVDASELLLKTEIPLIEIVASMEDRGILVDHVYASELKEKYGKKMEEVRSKCEESLTALLKKCDLPLDKLAKLESPINIGSPAQLAILFYDGLKLTSPDKGKPRGTGEDIIEHLASQQPELNAILEFREVAKLMSTYIEKIPASALSDGRVHTSFNQMGAKTGRFSSSDPVNMQNIPSKNKEIRKMFVASPGHVLVGADFSQQEPRVLTQISQDKTMLQAYAENRDIYAAMGAYVFGLPYEECRETKPDGSPNKAGKERRNQMKALVLAKMYGNGDKAVAENLGVSLKEAKEITRVFNAQIPGAQWAADYHKQTAHTTGYVKTVYGRKRRLPDILLPEYEIYREDERVSTDEYVYFCSLISGAWGREKHKLIADIRQQYGLKIIDNGGKIADAERQAMNSPIQGTAADITKKAMVAVGKSKKLASLGYRLLLTVHDELIGECPEDNVDLVVAEKEKLMIACCIDKISVPMKVDVEVSKKWTGEKFIKEV